MTETDQDQRHALAFIYDYLDSVPHLEALLLVWRARPAVWTPDQLAQRLYTEAAVAQTLLQDLTRRGLIVNASAAPAAYSYESDSPERDRLVSLADAMYRKHIVEVSTMIHSKPSAALRDFAQAFRFTRERK